MSQKSRRLARLEQAAAAAPVTTRCPHCGGPLPDAVAELRRQLLHEPAYLDYLHERAMREDAQAEQVQ